MLSRDWIPITSLVLLVAAACCWLGRWQLDRLAQRRAFNRHVESMQALLPLEFPAPEDLTLEEYRAVTATGVFDFGRELAIRNQAYKGEYGFHLVTPLLIATATGAAVLPQQAVLVDRGWIPANESTAHGDWRAYDTPRAATIEGVVRLGQMAPTFAGLGPPTEIPGKTGAAFSLYVDIDQIRRQLPYATLPVYIELVSGSSAANAPIPVVAGLDLSEGPHQGYAIQWFGFAGALIIGYPIYVTRQERRIS
jgi:surfeit locus 1 family protein